ncbi:MAG: hypothetical protein MI923_00595 [Phycisphaerales bacterium]|nr:hypothetical protein [Phycisphaerales bacterium]
MLGFQSTSLGPEAFALTSNFDGKRDANAALAVKVEKGLLSGSAVLALRSASFLQAGVFRDIRHGADRLCLLIRRRSKSPVDTLSPTPTALRPLAQTVYVKHCFEK